MGWGIRAAFAQYAVPVKAFFVWLRRPDIYRMGTPERLGIVYNASTHLAIPARLTLYAIVRGTRPERALEIGTALGGSAAIIAAAMEDSGIGKIIGIDPLLSERAFLVIDNGLHYGVHQALTDAIENDDRLHDCGFVCGYLGTRDRHTAYDGLRLMRFESNKVSDPQPIIEREFQAAGVPVPRFDREALNHDPWWCRTVRPCPKCARGESSSSRVAR
jgi:hypothetical protein